MDFIIDAIVEWLKGLLVDGLMGNLDGLYISKKGRKAMLETILQLLIRSGREEQAMMTTLAGLIVVLMMIISQISVLFDTIKDLFAL